VQEAVALQMARAGISGCTRGTNWADGGGGFGGPDAGYARSQMATYLARLGRLSALN
jgi:hypothetical protein